MKEPRKDILVGDKFIIEIGHTYYSPISGNKYFVKGFDSLVLTDYAIDKLERYEPPRSLSDLPHSCEFCVYQDLGGNVFPCSMCDKGMERTDRFEPHFER